MSVLDKSYKLIKLDLVEKTVQNIEMYFSISDNETSDFYIKITKNNNEIDLSDKIVKLLILDQDNIKKDDITLEYKTELDLYYCNLKKKHKNTVGQYTCQIVVSDSETGEQILTRNSFYYYILDDLLNKGKEPPDEGGSSNIKLEYNSEEKTLNIVSNGAITYNSEEKLIELEV